MNKALKRPPGLTSAVTLITFNGVKYSFLEIDLKHVNKGERLQFK